MPQKRVLVLCDNEADGDSQCGSEWGLALAVDLGQENAEGGGLWLWDTGQTDLFTRNAAHLGVDLASAHGLALSHGHYDHTGGLAALLAAGFRGSIHAHPSCALKRYAEEPGGRPRRPIGPPVPLPAYSPAGPLTRLAPGLTMLADIPRAQGNFQSVRGFSLDPEGALPDPVSDDAFLVLETDAGPVMLLGCCHSGLANSLSCARERLGHKAFYAVLGGLHLFRAGPGAIAETARALGEFDVRRLVAGHCTGADRLPLLREHLEGCEVLPLAAGQTWHF